ncbi:nuclear transport factor 2 family protein [Nonomuraea sp. NPDC026600]|uniref:nuclear transport factor 2 family protein n=1 Tax=Nonomuraea sp. NPDC026600 TaxID=3155363 RepID=UPI0033C4A757
MHTVDLDMLPEPITRYLAAHRTRDTITSLDCFTPDATVADDGKTYSGTDAIERWMKQSATEYTYTIEPIGACRTDGQDYTVTQRLKGDFPGGVVDLRFRFALRDGLVERLHIEP